MKHCLLFTNGNMGFQFTSNIEGEYSKIKEIFEKYENKNKLLVIRAIDWDKLVEKDFISFMKERCAVKEGYEFRGVFWDDAKGDELLSTEGQLGFLFKNNEDEEKIIHFTHKVVISQ